MVTVTGTYINAEQVPAQGTIYLSPCIRGSMSSPPVIVTEKRVYADLDDQGKFSLDVIPSTDERWNAESPVLYLVEERLSALGFRSYYITVPETGIDLADAQPVESYTVASYPVPGPEGPPGPPGPPGGSYVSGWWAYQTSEVMDDPGSGNVRSTAAAMEDPVSLALSNTDDDGVSWNNSGLLLVGDTVILRDTTGDRWDIEVTGFADNTSWTQIDGVLKSSTGSAPKKNTRVQVSLVRL